MKFFEKTGIVAYWLLHPALSVYMRLSRRTRVAIVCNDKILLVQSWLSSGDWYLPGGGVHKKEPPIVGAAREIREELALHINPSQLQSIATVTFKQGLIRYEADVFYTQLSKKPAIVMQQSEVSAYGWFTQSELDLLKMHSVTRNIIDLIWCYNK